MDAWIKLSPMESKIIWRKFKKKFQFKPSVHKVDWPGFKEPFYSITYDISSIFGNFNRKNLVIDLQKKALKAFQTITKPGDMIYALDWQHSCYKFDPRLSNENDDWKISALPDGDYYIFMTEDLKNGFFGHPWEHTVCILGEMFVKKLKQHFPLIFSKVLRKNV